MKAQNFCHAHGGPYPECAACIETMSGLLNTIHRIIYTAHQTHHMGSLEECDANMCTAGKRAIDAVLKKESELT